MDQTLIDEIELESKVPWFVDYDAVAKQRVLTELAPLHEAKARYIDPLMKAALALCSKKPKVFKPRD